MNVHEAVEFLEEKVKEVSRLKQLPHSSHEILLWRNSIEYILEEVFGRNSLNINASMKHALSGQT